MATSPSAPSAQHTTSTSSPALRGVLTWDSPAQRNRLLDAWRQAVMRAFAEQPRCLRLAWALDHLFNAKTGFAFASNGHFASKTGLTPRNVQKALATLEADGAIVRAVTVHRGAQRWRVVYPGKAILAVGVTSTVDVGGHVEGIWHTWLREAEEKLEPRCCECGKNVYDGKDNERCERATAVATSLSALMRATALRPVGKKPTASVLRLATARRRGPSTPSSGRSLPPLTRQRSLQQTDRTGESDRRLRAGALQSVGEPSPQATKPQTSRP
jgi:hypothetical protein